MSGSIVIVILLSAIIIDFIHNCFDQLCMIAIMIMMLYFVETGGPTVSFSTDNRCGPDVCVVSFMN